MRKRILFIVSIGVSFAPTVLAATNINTYRPNLCLESGQQSMNCTNPRGAQCELRALVEKAEKELAPATLIAAPGKPGAGKASGG